MVGKNQTPVAGCQVFEVIFSLLRHIDECTDDILFFADEGGSWEVGVNWFADGRSSEYAQRIATLLNRHYKHGRVKMLGGGDNASADATPGLDETCARRSYCKGS